MSRRRSALALLVSAIALLAASAAESPTEAVRATLVRAERVVAGDGTREEKLDALREAARDLFDTGAMGRRAMGDDLDARPPEQQAEFLELFDEFIVRAYLQKLLFFRDPRFGYGKEEVSGEEIIVHTVVRTENEDFYVAYAMKRRDERWLATDIVVEGVSLTRNYGEQFKSLLRTHSFEELLDRLRRKVERLRGEDA
ncbi:MAG: ABC transporter substrate-binding protein [Proteobacteria bacterium]|nr:ABC transporter substrate-binding protein [Pseudomonadota bacterium]